MKPKLILCLALALAIGSSAQQPVPAGPERRDWGETAHGFQMAASLDVTNGIIHCWIRNATTNEMDYQGFDIGYFEYIDLEIIGATNGTKFRPEVFPMIGYSGANPPYIRRIQPGKIITDTYVRRVHMPYRMFTREEYLRWSHGDTNEALLTEQLSRRVASRQALLEQSCSNDTFAFDLIGHDMSDLKGKGSLEVKVTQTIFLDPGNEQRVTLSSLPITLDDSLIETCIKKNRELLGVVAVAKVKLKFVKVDSEETESQNGHGENAVDGNPNTYWHTQWHGDSPGLPHEIIIEMLPPSVIKGFTYLPRQDESDHGTIKDYEFYVSDDGEKFGQPVKKGVFEPGKGEKIETFEPIECRFIKLKAITEINGLPWTSAAEIHVIQSGEDVSAMTNPINQATSLLAEFEASKSIDKLEAAYVTVGNIPEPGFDKTVSKAVALREKTRMLFTLLAVIDQNIDSSFGDLHNPEDQIFLNSVPPTPEGIRYPSGVDPNDIKDSKTRAQYEAAIKQNNDKILRANFQTRLHNMDQSANIFAERFLRDNYSASREDQSELENLMKLTKLSIDRTQKLKALFESNPSPNANATVAPQVIPVGSHIVPLTNIFPVLPPITNADPAIRVPLLIQVPARLSIQRTTDGLSNNDSLTVEIDRNSLETTNLMAATNMVTGVESRYFVFPEGEPRPANGGYGLGGTDFNLGTSVWSVKQDGLPLPGRKYVVELELTVFETDIPPQHMWDPHGKNYKILWQRTLKQKAPDADTFMVKIIKKIGQQLPELASPVISSGNSSPGETWKGEEFASAGFALPDNPRAWASVTIHRYGSSTEEQQDIERSLFRERQQGPDLKENYKGAVLYRWSAGRGGVVCQAGLYVVEIWFTREGGTPLEMKMLDVVLGELEAVASRPK